MRKFFKTILNVITVVTAVVYISSYLTPYVSPVDFWPMTFVALGFTVYAFFLFVLIVFWLFINYKVSIVLLIIFIGGYKNLTSTWAFNSRGSFNYNKHSSSLRILSWNVRYFGNNDRSKESPDSARRKMINFIKKANADIMLFQDYTDYLSPDYYSNLETIRDSLGYNYSYRSKDFDDRISYGGVLTGCAIYSRLPITDSGKIVYANIAEPESLSYADIVFAGKKLRVFTTHLISMSIRPHPGISAQQGKEKYDSAYKFGKMVTKTLLHYDAIHAEQADFVRSIINKSPYPSIISGDFNSVPSSYVFHTIKGDKQDVFLKKGFGLGHSYYALSKTLRIDYILVDEAFKVQQVTTPQLYLSDHFPVVTDITWKN